MCFTGSVFHRAQVNDVNVNTRVFDRACHVHSLSEVDRLSRSKHARWSEVRRRGFPGSLPLKSSQAFVDRFVLCFQDTSDIHSMLSFCVREWQELKTC